MKLELQKPKELVESAGNVKSVIGGALIGGATYLLFKRLEPKLFKRSKFLSHTIPPIIIKSDNLEFESEPNFVEIQSLQRDVGNAPLRPWRYRASTLNPEPGVVRIVRYNEDTVGLPVGYEAVPFPIGSLLKIWLQRFKKSSKTWEWVDLAKHQIQVSRSTNNSLEMEFDATLSTREDNDHSIRTSKYQYKGGKGLRFGKLQVTGFKPIEITKEGDEYIVSFNVH